MKKPVNKVDLYISNEEKEGLENDFKNWGFLLPTNDDELHEFNKVHGTSEIPLPEDLASAEFLFEKKNNPKKETKIKKSTITKDDTLKSKQHDYFKKVVLAAEIINNMYGELTLGHIKLVKILYLCEEVCNMKLNTNYKKFAAGPLDPKLLHTIDKELEKQKWFKKEKREDSYGFKYVPLENVSNYRKYYDNYYLSEQTKISWIISLFKKEKTDFCEIIATLYAVWKENLENNILINDETLIKGFYAWSPDKAKFGKNELIGSIKFMQEKMLYPIKK